MPIPPEFIQVIRHQQWAEPYITGARSIDHDNLDVHSVKELEGDSQRAGTVLNQAFRLIMENCEPIEADDVYLYAEAVTEPFNDSAEGGKQVPSTLPDIRVQKGDNPRITLTTDSAPSRSLTLKEVDDEIELAFMPGDMRPSLDELPDNQRAGLVIAFAALASRLDRNSQESGFTEYRIK